MELLRKGKENPLIDQYHLENAFVMAYGSRVKEQEGHTKSMIDFVFAVEDTQSWHQINLQDNRHDYSVFAKMGGIEKIMEWQKKGAKIYYHPFIKNNSSSGKVKIKYGVISLDDLVNDLEQWTDIYVAGRLHKPVEILHTSEKVDVAMKKNYDHAVTTALLLLPEIFTEEELYKMIASISFYGDTRQKYGIDKNKVTKVLYGKTSNISNEEKELGISEFRKRYKESLERREEESFISFDKENNIYTQNISEETLHTLVEELPSALRDSAPVSSLTQETLTKERVMQAIIDGLYEIISASSSEQTKKGIFTGGVVKSVRYVGAKVWKMVKGKFLQRA